MVTPTEHEETNDLVTDFTNDAALVALSAIVRAIPFRVVTVPVADGSTSFPIDLRRVTVPVQAAETVTKNTLMAVARVEDVQAASIRFTVFFVTVTVPEQAAVTAFVPAFSNETEPVDDA